MSGRGGRRTTTWSAITGSWKHKETKTIRVPIALADQILKYARSLDRGEQNFVTLGLLNDFINLKYRQWRRSHIQSEFTTETPIWKVFREFQRWLWMSK